MTRPKKVPKSQEELKANFKHAFDSLTLSIVAYDEGYKGETARLASVIYIFVHDHGRSSISLLTQVGRKAIQFHSTATPLNPKNLLTEMPLVAMRGGVGGIEHLSLIEADFEVVTSEQSFAEWWEAGVLRDNKRRIFSRKNLVFAFRHGEGGGHVSPDLDEAFAGLARDNSMGWVMSIGDRELVPEYGPQYATIRQIAHELRVTLVQHCADLLD